MAVLLILAGLVMAILASTATASESRVRRLEGPFETVTAVAYADNEIGVELMFAECDFVQRVEKPNGTAVETQTCHLTDPFVVFPGTTPTKAFVDRPGPCIWMSDYFLQTTGEAVFADSVRATVTPSGLVTVTTKYPAEPLTCENPI